LGERGGGGVVSLHGDTYGPNKSGIAYYDVLRPVSQAGRQQLHVLISIRGGRGVAHTHIGSHKSDTAHHDKNGGQRPLLTTKDNPTSSQHNL
jgi:hypothetical protein